MILSPRLAATTVSREVVQTPEINEKDGEHGLRLCQGNFSVLSAAPFRCCSFSVKVTTTGVTNDFNSYGNKPFTV